MNSLQKIAKEAISLMDLTTLNDDDNDLVVASLCKQALSPAGECATVCIYPRFIPIAKKTLKESRVKNVKIATVVNFPNGDSDIDSVLIQIKEAIIYGADEIDVVFPYNALINGDENIGYELIKACKNICGDITLKVILETGELKLENLIKKASSLSIDAGANFIKTSTGKVKVNATLDAAKIMLKVIKEKNKNVGIKIAGGVKDAKTAKEYLDLARNILGDEWLTKKHFRFGASSLLNNLLAELGLEKSNNTNKNGY